MGLCQRWEEFGWKTLIRYFITSCQKFHYNENPPVCWRKCGNPQANHFHIMWDCPLIKQYWNDVHRTLEIIFKCVIPFDIKTIIFAKLPLDWKKKDTFLFRILLLASKKCITKNGCHRKYQI